MDKKELNDMFDELIGAFEYETVTELTEEEKDEWEKMTKEATVLANKCKILDAKSQLWWATIEDKYDQVGSKLQIKDGKLQIRVDPKKKDEGFKPEDI